MFLLSLHRSSKDVFCGPARSVSLRDGPVGKSCAFRPFRHGETPTLKSEHDGFSGVSGLLFSRGPSTVIWAVVAVVIGAIQRMHRGWSRSHVLIETLKRRLPTVAYFNSAAAIILVTLLLWIAAPVDHIRPHVVLGSVDESMLCLDSLELLSSEAPAALCVSGCQRPSHDYDFPAAFAPAAPIGFSLFGGIVAQNSESSELLVLKVLHSGWGFVHLHSIAYYSFGYALKQGLV